MKESKKDILLSLIRNGKPISRMQQFQLAGLLSVPAILVQISSIIMEFIDASMVGQLGANQSASIGLVATSLWLIFGICNAAASGFSVQVAHLIGGKKDSEARNVFRQAITAICIFSLTVMLVGVSISPHLPHWLRGGKEVCGDASSYFMIFCCAMPMLALNMLAAGMLRSSGNIKTPSIFNVMMCALDVLFNFLLIYPTHTVTICGIPLTIPGAGWQVKGAALGSFLAITTTSICMMWYACYKSKEMRLKGEKGSFKPTRQCLRKAIKIGGPMGLLHFCMCSASIVITAIVAPLGSIALAANTFAITAESICYMPGNGIADAATVLIGQSIGAGRKALAKQMAGITVVMGTTVMTMMGVLLYFGAPWMMSLLSPVPDIINSGAEVLRIQAFAEPFFALSIVGYGVFVGAGDTLVPCGYNLASMWGVRLTLSALLVGTFGLRGVWIAMAVELVIRGLLYLYRLQSGKWLKSYAAT